MKVYITIGPDGGITVWPLADDAIRYATEQADRGNPIGVRKVEACSYNVDPGFAFQHAYTEQCRPAVAGADRILASASQFVLRDPVS